MHGHMNTIAHVFQGVTATGAIIAAEATMSSADWITMVERLGLAVALVVFFVVTGWAREKRMAARIDKLEKENEKNAKTTAALTVNVNKALSDSTKAVSDALKVLDSRMCWACKSWEEFQELKQVIADRKQEEKP